jgi:hypothetical protein
MSSICVHVKTVGKNTEPIKNNQIRKGSYLINPIEKKDKDKINHEYHLRCSTIKFHITLNHLILTLKLA